jgi:excisionase family DNA binding protein
MSDRAAVFVRLTPEQARRLDVAAAVVPAKKKDLIGGLVERYVDPETAEGVEALRELAAEVATPKRILGEERQPQPVRLPVPGGMTVGHAEFRPAPPREVLDAEQAAELLAVKPAALVELAEQGELPGRRIGGEWRFSRSALLAWLGGS